MIPLAAALGLELRSLAVGVVVGVIVGAVALLLWLLRLPPAGPP